MKTKEELTALKNEVEALNKKLAELTEEDLKKVNGGSTGGIMTICQKCGKILYPGEENFHRCRQN